MFAIILPLVEVIVYVLWAMPPLALLKLMSPPAKTLPFKAMAPAADSVIVVPALSAPVVKAVVVDDVKLIDPFVAVRADVMIHPPDRVIEPPAVTLPGEALDVEDMTDTLVPALSVGVGVPDGVIFPIALRVTALVVDSRLPCSVIIPVAAVVPVAVIVRAFFDVIVFVVRARPCRVIAPLVDIILLVEDRLPAAVRLMLPEFDVSGLLNVIVELAL